MLLAISVFGPWPEADGDDVAEDAHAGQHEIADNVENLVAGELLVEARGVLGQQRCHSRMTTALSSVPPLIKPFSSSGATSSYRTKVRAGAISFS